MTDAAPQMDVSICIVTYRARDYLRDCLESLESSTGVQRGAWNTASDESAALHAAARLEIIVVDNNSQDGIDDMLRNEFPAVRLIQNDHNAGYTRPMNQALQAASQTRYLMQLNPDTLVLPHAIERLVAYMDEHPQVGICGPKVLNRDGSLQKSCRRGESRPWAVFTYFSGLAARYPNSPRFSQYHVSYLDENQTAPVDGVSGSCMLIRQAVVDQIGYLDELFFAYQEDADYCFRARQAGWQVVYLPLAQIVHYGGMGGSKVEPYRSIFEWHRSYYNYYRKNLARDYFFLFNWFYYLAMLIKLGLALAANFVRGVLRQP